MFTAASIPASPATVAEYLREIAFVVLFAMFAVVLCAIAVVGPAPLLLTACTRAAQARLSAPLALTNKETRNVAPFSDKAEAGTTLVNVLTARPLGSAIVFL